MLHGLNYSRRSVRKFRIVSIPSKALIEVFIFIFLLFANSAAVKRMNQHVNYYFIFFFPVKYYKFVRCMSRAPCGCRTRGKMEVRPVEGGNGAGAGRVSNWCRVVICTDAGKATIER